MSTNTNVRILEANNMQGLLIKSDITKEEIYLAMKLKPELLKVTEKNDRGMYNTLYTFYKGYDSFVGKNAMEFDIDSYVAIDSFVHTGSRDEELVFFGTMAKKYLPVIFDQIRAFATEIKEMQAEIGVETI